MRYIESGIQVQCVKWFRLVYPHLALNLFSVPNGGSRHRVEGAIMKAEGCTAGVSDLLLLAPSPKGYHGLCIEMKRPKAYQRPSQKAWQACVEAQGYKYIVCRSLDEFRTEIFTYFHE